MRPGFDPDIVVRAQYFSMAAERPKRGVTAWPAIHANSAEVVGTYSNTYTMSLEVE